MPGSEPDGSRAHGSAIVDELCDARDPTPCVGLVECEILYPRQNQDLLVARATQLRVGEGRSTALHEIRGWGR